MKLKVNWKKLIGSVIILMLMLRVILIVDVYANKEKNLKLEKVEDGKYKVRLFLRNFYIYNAIGEYPNLVQKNFTIKAFPEFSYSDGLNYGKNISGLPSWQSDESDRLGLNINAIVIPYDWNIFPFLNLGQIHEEVVFTIQVDEKNEPISIQYHFLNKSEKE